MTTAWRTLLEARWQERLLELTELSLAYHGAADEGAGDGASHEEARALLRHAVAARRKLADVEEALDRLATGCFGRCEQCGLAIPAGLLRVIPETRYCPRCDGGPAVPDQATVDRDAPPRDAPHRNARHRDSLNPDAPHRDARRLLPAQRQQGPIRS